MIQINTKELCTMLDTFPAEQNIMLVGNHGIGKSEILTNYFKDKGMKVIALFLGQMSDPGDLIGLPSLNKETGTTEFMPPYWFPVDNKPIVLFLDELNRARPEMLQSVMDLALNRKLAGRMLPPGSRIISAINDGEEYQVGELDPALVSRFNIYKFQPSVEEWIIWASKAGVDDRIVKFISENKDFLDLKKGKEDNALDKSPDRRAWVKVSNLIKGVDNISGMVFSKMICGIVGVKAQQRFNKFISKKTSLSGKDIITAADFKKLIPALAKMTVPELCTVNEDIFRHLETQGGKTENVYEYIKFIDGNKKGEAVGQFMNFLTDFPVYPEANKIIARNKRIMDFVTEFISNI